MLPPASGLVTPEGVLLQVPFAGPGTRIVARGLDTLIQIAAVTAFALTDAALSGGSLGTAGAIADLFAVPLIVFGYPAIMEAAWHGRTLGKAALGLRVMTREGAPCRFRHTLIRSMLYAVDGLLLGPAIGIILLVLTRDTVRLGDLAAGTVVIRERSGAAMPAATTFVPPPGLEDLTAYVDIGRLSPADYEIVRAVLIRAPSLNPDVRWNVAGDIAARVANVVGFRPPPGLHPEAFLQAVAAAYQRRHGPYQAPNPGWAPASSLPVPPNPISPNPISTGDPEAGPPLEPGGPFAAPG